MRMIVACVLLLVLVGCDGGVKEEKTPEAAPVDTVAATAPDSL